MTQRITAGKIAKNITLSLMAQAVSLAASFVLSMLVPRYIPELDYSYWQTYLLYVGYVGVLHFGILDGLVLRYSQYDYEELDKPRIRSQLHTIFTINTVAVLLCAIGAFLFCSGTVRFIVLAVAIGIWLKNLFAYTSYTFQFTNRINKYALLVIIDRALYAGIVAVCLICKVQDFHYYIAADLVATLIAVLIMMTMNRGMYFGKSLTLRENAKETKINISCGFVLMLANFSAMLIVGLAKMFVQWRWDELVFGKVAFAFSVSALVLTVVSAISVVLFPSLKRMDRASLPKLYVNIRNVISPLLFFVVILYFPGAWVLEKWLPNYAISLTYLGILFPICIFSAKVNLLTNNYLKAYRKEKTLMLINVGAVAIGAVVFAIGAYAVQDLNFILYGLVLLIMAHSVVSELAVSRLIRVNLWKDFLAEFAMTVVYVICAQFLSLLWGGLAYLGALIVYGIVYRKNIMTLIRRLKIRRQKTDLLDEITDASSDADFSAETKDEIDKKLDSSDKNIGDDQSNKL